jgi:CRP/FNR family transcriptional regulator
VVDSGSVRIIRENPHDERELALAVLGSGEIFGELALIDDEPRSASAIAATDSEMIVLRRDDFMDSLRSQPEHLDLVLGFISQRLRRTDQLALLLAFGSPQQRLEFSLMGFLDSTKLIKRKAGVSVLKVGPNDLAAAAGTDIESSLAYLDVLRDRRLCTYTDKHIKFIVSEDEYRRGVVF